MRKKWIVIIVLCVLLLAVAALRFSLGLGMKPELAAVGYTEGAAPAEDPGLVVQESVVEELVREAPVVQESASNEPAGEPVIKLVIEEPVNEELVIEEQPVIEEAVFVEEESR